MVNNGPVKGVVNIDIRISSLGTNRTTLSVSKVVSIEAGSRMKN